MWKLRGVFTLNIPYRVDPFSEMAWRATKRTESHITFKRARNVET